MQKEININEFENVVSTTDDIEPMIIKRKNKLEQYQKEMFLAKLEKSKEDYKQGKVYSAKNVFKKLREKYGY